MRTINESYYNIIKDFITRYRFEKGYAPSIYEIASGTGIPRSTANRYMLRMRDQGEITYEGHRSIEVKNGQKHEAVLVPVLGKISCGLPILAQENIDEYVSLPVSIFGNGDYYILNAKGDSMIEAGIDDGDRVLVRTSSHAEAGDIVVALIGDEATLKRYFPEPENRRVRLHPENSALSDIFVENCLVQGVAVQVIKSLH